jgi:hypothetical protein
MSEMEAEQCAREEGWWWITGGGGGGVQVLLLWNGVREKESRAGRCLKAWPRRGGGCEPVQVQRFRPAVRRRPPRPVDELHAASAAERGALWLASGCARRGRVRRT